MFWKTVDRIVDALAGTCLLLMAAIVALQVFYRYVLNRPLLWPFEVSLFFFVWLIWIGGAAGIRDERQIRIELAERYLPVSILRFLLPFLYLISIALIVLVVYYGIQVTAFQATAEYDVIPFPRSVLYVVAPIVGCLMGVFLFRCLFRQIRRYYPTAKPSRGD